MLQGTQPVSSVNKNKIPESNDVDSFGIGKRLAKQLESDTFFGDST